MVPLPAVTTTHWTSGPSRLQRYNGVESMNIQGQGAAGRSSDEAMAAMEELARRLPKRIGFEWSGTSYQQQAGTMYALSIVAVFLCLAALYESWSIPVAVILVVPLGVLGALLATVARARSACRPRTRS